MKVKEGLELLDYLKRIKNPILRVIVVVIVIFVIIVSFLIYTASKTNVHLNNQSNNIENKDVNYQKSPTVNVSGDNNTIVIYSDEQNTKEVKENIGKSRMQTNLDIYEVARGGWGDNSNTEHGRDVFEMYQVANGILEDKVAFNSITNGQYHDANKELHKLPDERNFVGAREYNTNNIWNMDEIIVEDGKDYYISMFVHNDNKKGYDSIGYDTRVSYSIPGNTSNKIIVNGFISCVNAIPSKYWDSIVFVSKNNQLFHLEYYSNSALWESNGRASGKLSDDIINRNGVLIGYESLDGRIPGGYEYSGYAGVKVKVVFDK